MHEQRRRPRNYTRKSMDEAARTVALGESHILAALMGISVEEVDQLTNGPIRRPFTSEPEQRATPEFSIADVAGVPTGRTYQGT
jgi:hypothetical protein